MRRTEFSYELSENLIAQFPLGERGNSRLLCLCGEDGALKDRKFSELPELLRPGDLLVINDTRVIPARLFGQKKTGGQVEIMIERVLDDQQILAQLRVSKTPKPGSVIFLEGGFELELISRKEDMFILKAGGERKVTEILEEIGHVPLPPYIRRTDEKTDKERYQTVYAQQPGAVAAPTAGLHFTEELLKKLANQGINMACVTLHVGAGTFQPVRTENIEDHKMHSEYLEVLTDVCERVNVTKKQGGRIIAVGTTTVRCLEMAAGSGTLKPYSGETDIFIYPGFRFRIVDVLITNFHLPESTLLMLVCAFAGRKHVLNAYQHAIAQKYQFYSYGDAMFITRKIDL